MKNVISLLLIFSFVACKKTGTDIAKPELIGSWHLVYIFGEMTDPTPKDSIVLTIAESNYTTTTNTTITETGTYKLSVEKNSGLNDTIMNFYTGSGTYSSQMHLFNDSLALTPQVFSPGGGESFIYKKQ